MKKSTFWLGFLAGTLGIVGHFVSIPVISGISFWLVAAGFVLLLLGYLIKGM